MRITKVKNNEENKAEVIRSDSLYEDYNFVTNVVNGNDILKHNVIEYVYSKRFFEIKNKEDVEKIFYIANNCEIVKSMYNFNVYSSGDILLGYRMRCIKENIDEYKNAWENFLNKDCANIIKIEL